MKNKNKPILHVKRKIARDLMPAIIIFYLLSSVWSEYPTGHPMVWFTLAVAYFPTRYYLINLIYSLTDAKFYNNYIIFNNRKITYTNIDFVEISKMLLRNRYKINFLIKNKRMYVRIRVKDTDISKLKELLSDNNVNIIYHMLIS